MPPTPLLLLFGVVAALIAWHSSQSHLPAYVTPDIRPTRCLTSQSSASLTGAAARRSQQPYKLKAPEIRRIFVVGCGHSGTSLLLRTIGNMPGVKCYSEETGLFLHDRPEPEIEGNLTMWDKEASDAGFTSWVEKTPKHVLHIGRLLEKAPTRTKVVLIYRDGRDVVASLTNRGLSWEEAVQRYIEENEAALPFLDDDRVFTVRFEEFMEPDLVLGILKELANFLDITVSDIYLAAGLLASSQPLELGGKAPHCRMYNSDEEKFEDLAQSFVGLLSEAAEQSKSAVLQGCTATPAPAPVQNDTAISLGMGRPHGHRPSRRDRPTVPTLRTHQKRRTEQMSQAWQPQSSIWENELDDEKKEAFGENPRVEKIMKRLEYFE